MTTSTAPDVDRVLDRMGRSAFGYRSFPRPEHEAAPPREAVTPPPPQAPPQAPKPGVTAAPVRFPLIVDALPPSAAPASVAPPPATPPPPPPPAAPAAAAPPNPFLPRAPAAPPPQAVPCTSLAGMFRLLSGRADSARPPMADSARPRDDIGARAPAFPFRHG